MIRLLPVLALLAGCAFVPSEAIDDRLDADGDGSVAPAFGGDDCADDDAAVNPSATDAPGDTVDQDCDGVAFCPDGDDDADGVCDGADVCSVGPDGSDADADGVPDACDLCAGDDTIDLDADTVPDACDVDDDGDAVPDDAELAYGSDPRVQDTDGDGILDGVENANHDGVIDPSETDAFDEDTDGDGLCDGDVVVADCVGAEGLSGTEPLDEDTDGDGLYDGEEVDRTKTSPLISDSDADNLSDGVEDRTDTNPNAPDTDGDGWPDGGEDRDWDGVVDADETDPRVVDTDGDGLADPDEAGIDHVVGPAETDPRDPDTDGDGLLDGAEAVGDFDTDGLVDARDTDSDADGLADGAEVALGTGVHDKDSDDDGLLDGDEVALWESSPLVADTDGDTLSDGYEAKTSKTDPTAKDTDVDGLDDDVELEDLGTDPLDADTDDDGLVDGVEDTDGSDPLDADTDDDSLLDGAEDADGTDPLDPDSDADGRCDGPRLDGEGDGVDPADACGWVWFVDAGAAPGGDGMSWATAFKSIPDHAVVGDNDVWVRAGTYRAVAAGQPVLALAGTTRVYGGFAGTEAVFADRPTTLLPTILEGDRDASGGPTLGDSAHVVLAPGGAIVDGFIVRHGNASNGGAGLYVDGAQDLLVRDVRFEDGYTAGFGGGVYARFADLTLQDVQIVRGRAGLEAGGLYVEGGVVSLNDVEVTGSDAPIGAGVVVRVGALHVDQAWIHANRTTAGVAGAGAAFLGATVDGTGLRIEANELNDAPSCLASKVSGGGGLYVGAGSNVTIDDGTVSRNVAQLVGGACVANATLVVRGSTMYDNTGVDAIYVDGGSLTVQDTALVGSSVAMVHAAGANARVVVVDATVAQRSSVISLNLVSGAYARVIGSSLSGSVFATGVADVALSHAILDSSLFVSGSAAVDHTGATGFSGPGAGNLNLSGDPFVRRDLDLDGVPELYLKHAGLDAQVTDGPGVNGGDATVLDALLAPYALDWRLGSTRSDGALDSGAPDLGRHY